MSIDWNTQYANISDIIRRFARPICRDRGWDVDDIVSGTVERMVRQGATNPYDPERGSLGHYCTMQAKAHIADQLSRAAERVRHTSLSACVDGEAWDLPDPSPAMDDVGLDDEQIATMEDMLLDARLTLAERRLSLPHMRDARGRYIGRAESADISYRALLTWLRCDRDVAHTCRITGLSEPDLLAYLGWVVGTLERYGDEPYRRVWAAIRQSVRRRRQWAREALAEASVDASMTFVIP